jgi:hypothetical protein
MHIILPCIHIQRQQMQRGSNQLGQDGHGQLSDDRLRLQNKSLARTAAAIFLVRDGVTIFGSFTLAPWLSCANRRSFHSASGTLANIVVANVIAPAAVISSLRLIVFRGLRRHALGALRQPGLFVFQRPFGIVWALYAATYSEGSLLDERSKFLFSTEPSRLRASRRTYQ